MGARTSGVRGNEEVNLCVRNALIGQEPICDIAFSTAQASVSRLVSNNTINTGTMGMDRRMLKEDT